MSVRQERVDWQAQTELFKRQTLSTLSDRDQQVQQLSTMLEEARAHRPKVQAEQYQREVRRRGAAKTRVLTVPCVITVQLPWNSLVFCAWGRSYAVIFEFCKLNS